MAARPRVFVGSSSEGLDIAKTIQLNLDHLAEVTLWSQGVFGLGEGTLESLVACQDQFDFAVLVLSPDDLVNSRGSTSHAPRDNIMFELGLFMGSLGRNRTFAVYDRTANIKLPSDLAGVTVASFHPHSTGNLTAALGASCTLIENAIHAQNRRSEKQQSDYVQLAYELLLIPGYDISVIGNVLDSVQQHSQVNAEQIAASRHITPHTIDTIVDSMIQRNLLENENHRLRLTHSGIEFLEALRRHMRAR
jgi:DNA-binding MarR family transcriptional regulator